MLGQLLRARDASDLSLTSEQPLDRFIVTWLERKLMRGALRPHSFRAYRGLLAHAVHDPALGNMTLGAITPTHIERFIDTCLRGGLSRTTVIKLHVVLKAVFGDAVDQLGTELTGIAEGLAQTLQAALSTISHPPPPPATVVAHQRVPSRVERPQPAAAERPPRQAPSDAEGLSKGKRTILETLARRHPMVVTLAQLATLARYSPGSGSFQQNLRELRDQGLITRQGREIEITEDGLAALDHIPLPAQTPEELVALWRDALTGGARTIFDLLVEQYPRPLTRDEIAAACNYSPTSGSFQQSLRDLRRNGLAELEGGNYRASPTLFLQEESQ